MFCFLVSGPGLSFPSAYHTLGTVPIRTPTSSGDLPFLPFPLPGTSTFYFLLDSTPGLPHSSTSNAAHPSLSNLLSLSPRTARKGPFPPGTHVISALKSKGRLQDTKIRKWDSVNGKGSQRKQECEISPSIVPAFVRRQSILTHPPPGGPTKTSWPSSRVGKQRLAPS